MTVPIIDTSWHRLPEDAFDSRPSTTTPLDPTSSTHLSDDESASDWSCDDDEELVTLDLGTDRIARRALLGYSAGLDSLETESATTTSSRNVRSSRGTKRTTSTNTTEANTAAAAASAHHLGAGKMLSITGLDTNAPLMKIDDTVLRGRRMDLLGSEIVLQDSFDPTRPRGQQHIVAPLAPTTSDARPNAASSSTSKRILLRPIYDPTSRETASAHDEAFAALQALASVPAREAAQAKAASVADLMSTANEEGDKGVGRGKYKRKEVSETEQIIRAAERKARKAGKEFFKEQKQAAQQSQSDADDPQATTEPPSSQALDEPRPPTPVDDHL